VKKIAKWVFIALLIIVAGLQFVRPDRTNPGLVPGSSVTQNAVIDSAVELTFRQACYDCHSFETVWPWYTNISPVSWLVASDVNNGRRHLNFSIWGKYPVERKQRALDDIKDQLGSGDMPLAKYVLLHPQAALDAGQRKMLIDWAQKESDRLDKINSTPADSTQ
jgi:hypothetical protein